MLQWTLLRTSYFALDKPWSNKLLNIFTYRLDLYGFELIQTFDWIGIKIVIQNYVSQCSLMISVHYLCYHSLSSQTSLRSFYIQYFYKYLVDNFHEGNRWYWSEFGLCRLLCVLMQQQTLFIFCRQQTVITLIILSWTNNSRPGNYGEIGLLSWS